MPPRYVIILQPASGPATELDASFKDDIHAMVATRRLFVEEFVASEATSLSLTLGKAGADGRIDWLSTWSSPPPNLAALEAAVQATRRKSETPRAARSRRSARAPGAKPLAAGS